MKWMMIVQDVMSKIWITIGWYAYTYIEFRYMSHK